MNYYSDNFLTKKKENKKKYHRTRFIVYLALWLCSSLIGLIIFFFGLLVGGILGFLIGWLIWIILKIVFLILWIYHLIKCLKSV
jgi:uncharacterized membrane protein SpoIIM required for sporulation